ncbi:DUF6394 family protein [Limisalsivibrio acetivorans]|uniref:DUF6394 family protein n=1 Tax=Limisalsivibrio acetivorans TaxID=1304888 RepID=UPI0003B72841|nr:DUF6394 family protein [Limisalsivibrio acetivorans]
MIEWGRVWSDFFIFIALTTNVGFIFGQDPYQLVIAVGVNLIAAVMKFNVKKILAAELLATAFAANLHLIPAAVLYFNNARMSLVLGLAAGAAVANVISLIIVLIDLIAGYKNPEEF